jgi:glycine oxidase
VPSSPDILVIGAGVLGLCTAVELTRRGHAVTVVDRGGPNASSVAAGMIAPAMETLADLRSPDVAADHSALFRAARDLWPAFAEPLGIALYREGAEWRGRDPGAVRDALRERGFVVGAGEPPFTPEDWRLDPADALAQMEAAAGLTRRNGAARSLDPAGPGWVVTLGDGAIVEAPRVVLATGALTALTAPDAVRRLFDRITPIKGQLAFAAGVSTERVVRGDDGYVAPAVGGALIGATMDPGRTDLEPDLVRGDALLRHGLAMLEVSALPPLDWRVGVRGATPDGLPMAGAASAPGLSVALAPRRNGWMLGPLVARIVADGIEGRPPGAHAAALDPSRFG